MNFFDKTGSVAIGSRLRMVTEMINTEASNIYKMYGIDIKPKWFPVIKLLSGCEDLTVTGIAKEIGHTHPSVSNIISEMKAKGLVEQTDSSGDKRCTVVKLTRKGRRLNAELTDLCEDVEVAVKSVLDECCHNLWRAIGEWEEQLKEKSLLERTKEAKRAKEQREVEIIPFQPCHAEVFRTLNEQWIRTKWEVEPHDLDYIANPQKSIIDNGGFIFVAIYKGTPVGVCALCTIDNPEYDYELAKLAVNPDVRGKGIGLMLCRAALDKAREMKAKNIFLESNTSLKPAIHTYKKLGFKEIIGFTHTDYARVDIQMRLELK